SYLIDTIIKGMPIPPIYLRVTQSEDKKHSVREVIDGQQRLQSVLRFMEGQYSLTKSVSRSFGGKHFRDLPENIQDAIRSYSFNCEVFHSISDTDVLDTFARLNTYSIPLNGQELRNGKFFGLFKQLAYALAHEHLQFWRNSKIFTEDAISRMLEVELTSELMIVLMNGQQDKKKSIETFYSEYDEEFSEARKVESRFRSVIDFIAEYIGGDLVQVEFRRVPFFYTLFCVVAHRAFGIPREKVSTAKKGRLNKADGDGLRDAVIALSDKIVAAKNDEKIARPDVPLLLLACDKPITLALARFGFRLYIGAHLCSNGT
ncbi:MAG: DUF262 domain-containing protein, partial [Blastocatellia bacterium]